MFHIDNQPGFSGTFNDPTRTQLVYDLDKVDGTGHTEQMLLKSIAESVYKEEPQLEQQMPK